jgi:hypothetical protein
VQQSGRLVLHKASNVCHNRRKTFISLFRYMHT